MNLKLTVLTAVSMMWVGCDGTVQGPDDGAQLEAVQDDDLGSVNSELSTGVPLGSVLATTGNLNLRTGPGTSYSIRLVIPKGAHVVTQSAAASNGWYNIKYNGTIGWSSGTYLKLVSTPAVSITANTRDGAIQRAKSGVGGTYWWGHGRWVPFGSNGGSCTGSCPSCSHSGSTGADCSGYVAKIWEVPSSNSNLQVDSHPYSTSSFYGSNSQWHSIARTSLVKADALVYRKNGAGHIVLYESGDGWNSFWAYEAKGCSYGIRHNSRTASSAYKSIRHY
ncbi:MAG: SH3 domain-containing protein [Archangiaceae bacterium]|nr:SH3 domain-containing protein [Archangiaceae bacterium]